MARTWQNSSRIMLIRSYLKSPDVKVMIPNDLASLSSALERKLAIKGSHFCDRMQISLHINLQMNGGILAVSNVIVSITVENELVLCLVSTTNPDNKQAGHDCIFMVDSRRT